MLGETISHYRLLRKLGQGGMGEVYLAEDTRLGRKVALKFLSPELVRHRESLIRFRNEAKAAAELSHPNIATIHDIGDFEATPFLVLEYLEGQTLRERAAEGPLPIEEVLRIGKALAAGLAEAHSHGIVHRDIKSANVMLTKRGDVKILDFGLAHRVDSTQITREGTTLGTIGYMSPEQARGERADEQSDIWSLGIVLYECLTGRLPFTGTGATMIEQIKSADVPPPTALRTGIPMPLEQAVLRSLEKDKKSRLQSARELHAALLSIDSSVSQEREVRPDVPGRTTFRRWAAFAGIIGLMATATYLVLHDTEPNRDTRPPRLAVMDFKDWHAVPDPARVAGLTALMQAGLSGAQEYGVVSPEYLQEIQSSKLGIDSAPLGREQALTVAREAGATHVLTGEIQGDESTRRAIWRIINSENGDILKTGIVEAEGWSSVAASAGRDVGNALLKLLQTDSRTDVSAVATLGSSNPLAYQHYSAGVLAKSEGDDRVAREHFLKAVELDSTFAMAQFELSRQYDPNTEPELRRAAVARARRHEDRLGHKERMLLRAYQLSMDGDRQSALDTLDEILTQWPDFKDALRLRPQMHYFVHDWSAALESSLAALRFYPDEGDILHMQASALYHLGQWRSALQVLPPDYDPALEGWIHIRLGDIDRAAQVFTGLLADNPGDASATIGLAACSSAEGDLSEAILRIEESLARARGDARTEHYLVNALRQLYGDAGRIRELRELRTTTDIWYYSQLPLHLLYAGLPQVATDWLSEAPSIPSEQPFAWSQQRIREFVLISCWIELGQLERAVESYESLLASVLSNRSGWLREWRLLLGAQLAVAQGDFDTAEQLMDELFRDGFVRRGAMEIQILETEALMFEARGDLERAIEALEDVTRVFGSRALAHYRLGVYHEQAGQLDQAREAFTQALTLWSNADPDYPYPPQARQRLLAIQG